MSDVKIVVDDRVRVVTAVLAAGTWPEQEQAQEVHAVHPHAKQTRQFVQPWQQHAAVLSTNGMLAAGVPPAHLFAAALRCAWPDFTPQAALPSGVAPEWPPALADFARETAVDDFWQQHDAPWQEAVTDLSNIFSADRLPNFVGRLTGKPLPHQVNVMPNLVYPALSAVLAEAETSLYLLLPPPKAVGESPPWPYREGPDWVLAESCHQLLSFIWAAEVARFDETRRSMLAHAAITLFLEEASGEADGMAYMVRSKKQFGLPALPAAVEQLRVLLAENGSLADLQI